MKRLLCSHSPRPACLPLGFFLPEFVAGEEQQLLLAPAGFLQWHVEECLLPLNDSQNGVAGTEGAGLWNLRVPRNMLDLW